MATLSLYLFNLLPLPHLDGTQLLDALLDLAFSLDDNASASSNADGTTNGGFAFTFTYDIDALEGGAYDQDERRIKRTRTRKRWKDRIMKYVPLAMGCVVVCSILFGVINAVY